MRAACLAAALAVLGAGAGALAAGPTVAWRVATNDWGDAEVAAVPGGGVYVASTNSGDTAGTVTYYTSAGVQGWRVAISPSSRAEAVAVDAAGNCYVSGETYVALDGTLQGAGDLFVRKYSRSGVLQWGRQAGTALYDWPAGLAVTGTGTAYVTSGPWATNYGTPPPGTYTTVRKYQSDGTAGWVATLNTQDGTYPGDSAASGSGSVLDSQGNVVSMFANYTNNNNTIAGTEYLAKTSPSGQVQWIKSLGQLGNLFGTAIDRDDNIYVADWSLSKYDSAGNLLWRSSMANWSANKVTVAPDGTVYVCGRNMSQGVVAAYDASGQQLWSQTYAAIAGADGLAFTGVTYSGQQLVLTGQQRTGTYTTGNQILALNVPEPSSLGLMAAGVLMLGRRRRA